MPLNLYQLNVTSNDPQGASFMDSTSPSYLVLELQDLKATVRGQSLQKTWISLLGLTGIWVGGLAWTVISGTQASIQGDQTVATGTGYIIVGNRVQAFVTAGTIYGTITAAVAGGGITTVTVTWDAGAALDSGLTDIRQALDLSKVITSAPNNYAVITNGGAGSAFTGAISPVILSYVQAAEYRVRWTQASQGNDTIALNGLAALTVKKIAGGALVNLAAGDIPAGTVSDLIYDSTGPTLILVGYATDPATNLVTIYDRSIGNPAVDVVNTAAETTIYSKSIPGNTIGIDGALRILVEGDYLNNTGGAGTVQVKFKFGGTTVLDTGALGFGGSANRTPITFDVLLGNLGVTNAQRVRGRIDAYATPVTNGMFATTSFTAGIGQYAGLAIDTTTAQTLQITVTLGSANALLEYRSFQVYVMQIPA